MTTEMQVIFEEALAITGKGMASLFAFMFVFFLLLVLLDRLFPGKNDEAGKQIL